VSCAGGFDVNQGRIQGCQGKFKLLSLYQRFEHLVVMVLTALIAVAVWNLSLKILFGLVLSGSLDPSD
jgi:hypothetical protein